MKCPKCNEEIEPRLLNEWTQYGGYKFAQYQCPQCEIRFRQGKDNAVEFEKFVVEHTVVEEWMAGRPENTGKAYASNLMRFCEAINLTPETFQNLARALILQGILQSSIFLMILDCIRGRNQIPKMLRGKV